MARRKRTNKNVPAKGRLRDMCDSLWSLAVRADWANKCAACGAVKCEAHHLVPRQHEATRYNLRNGIALCAMHHQFDKDISPHQNAAGWMTWLQCKHPKVATWYSDNRRPTFNGTKNPLYYCDTILSLREYVDHATFVSIVGMKFSRYLVEEHSIDIEGQKE